MGLSQTRTAQRSGMAFFDEEKDNEVDQEEKIETTPEKIKVGDDEYTQEELNKLVSLGKIGKEAEEKFNTDITRVWPDYNKTKNELKSLQEQANKPQPEAKQEEIDEQIKQAQVKLRDMGFMTKEDYSRERETEKLLSKTRKLERSIDGNDGRPAFRTNTVLEHMVATGIKDPRVAYKDIYEKELDTWKANQLSKKTPGITTLDKGHARKEPDRVKVTSKNLRSLVRAALGEREQSI